MPIEFSCSQCGGHARLVIDPTTSMKTVMLRVENAHAAQHPECPLNRNHLTLTIPN